MSERQTLDDIAGSIMATDAADDKSPKGGDDSTDDDALVLDIVGDDADGDDDASDDATDDQTGDDADDDQDPHDGGEDEDDDDAGDDDAFEIIPIEDTDTIDVIVDGEEQTFTIADAKKALSGEGAIEKRLQEATLTRNTMREERELGLDQVRKQYNVLHQAVGHLAKVLFAPNAAEPDPALLNTDLTSYQKQDIAFRKDQERIQTLQQQVGNLFAGIQEHIEGDLKKYRAQEKEELQRALPILKDPTKGKIARKEILDAAAHYGFTAKEIGNAYDARMFLMAYDAAQYRKSLVDEKTEVKTGKRKRKNAPKVMRHGSTTAKSKARQSTKRRAQVKERAQETGKVDDIAAMIMQPARRKRR
jgi:hypothetical protein